ncbi:MAG: lipopolysaccharide assembly protein LapB [Coxiella sp. (in: Bacteria)]|nr:MAG: lipopolysaccharide assembly protein LapB [Coxiella sp. (in: g-proteobacteria)]
MQLTFLLLPVAATFGWFMGRKDQQQNPINSNPNQLRHDYFKGLNYLINEQPDKAVDVFIKLLEIDSDTVETHLALGNLFRRRGEVDRAIRIHQNLIARPQLNKPHRVLALSALGQDYLSAGVLDRAERLFLELVRIGEENQQSLQFLLRIYEQEKDWKEAIEIARKIEGLSKKTMSATIAQYYCELAEQVLEKSWVTEALAHLKRAQAIDQRCVRSSMVRGRIAMEAGEYLEAIRSYKFVRTQDPDYLSEIIEPLWHCYAQLGDEASMVKFLHTCLVDTPRIKIVLAISNYLQEHADDKAAIDFVAEQVQRRPSLRGLSHLVGIYTSNSRGDTREKLRILKKFIDMLLSAKPVYRCENCGFSAKTLLWLCPGCHKWSRVKPIQGLEGS